MISFGDLWKSREEREKEKDKKRNKSGGSLGSGWFNWRSQLKIGLIILVAIFLISIVNFYLNRPGVVMYRWVCQDGGIWILNPEGGRAVFLTPKKEAINLMFCSRDNETQMVCSLQHGKVVFLLDRGEIDFLDESGQLKLRTVCQK